MSTYRGPIVGPRLPFVFLLSAHCGPSPAPLLTLCMLPAAPSNSTFPWTPAIYLRLPIVTLVSYSLHIIAWAHCVDLPRLARPGTYLTIAMHINFCTSAVAKKNKNAFVEISSSTSYSSSSSSSCCTNQWHTTNS